MTEKLKASVEPLSLGEIVRAELQRALPEGGWAPPEDVCVEDLILTTGRNYLAARIGVAVNSPMAWMAVGTGTTAAALTDGSTPGLYGEIKRKALSTNSALSADNIYTAVATFGGAADSVSSIAITEGALVNHVGSGQGTMFQRVTFAAVTMADSDLFKLTLQTNVGST